MALRVERRHSMEGRLAAVRFTQSAAISAIAWAPYSALGSEWVIIVDAETNCFLRIGSPEKKTPMMALRIAAPFPAEKTPLFFGEKPTQSFRMLFKVANPIPAGRQRSQRRSFQARQRAKATGSSGCFKERLGDENRVVGIVADHATAEKEPVGEWAFEDFAKALRAKSFVGKAEGIADRATEEAGFETMGIGFQGGCRGLILGRE